MLQSCLLLLSAADHYARDLLAANNLLLEDQRRVDALKSVSVNYESAVDHPSGPALKTPDTVNAVSKTYALTKRSDMLQKS